MQCLNKLRPAQPTDSHCRVRQASQGRESLTVSQVKQLCCRCEHLGRQLWGSLNSWHRCRTERIAGRCRSSMVLNREVFHYTFQDRDRPIESEELKALSLFRQPQISCAAALVLGRSTKSRCETNLRAESFVAAERLGSKIHSELGALPTSR